MKSYRQRCGLAKALDMVGDRWVLLIVRELLIRHGCRFTDVKNGLPGIATNLLSARLKELEAAGVIRRQEEPPPIAATLFYLTDRGLALEPAVQLLGAWGAPLLAKSRKEDAVLAHWIVLPLRQHLRDHTPNGPPVSVELRSEGQPIVISTAGGRLAVNLESAQNPQAILEGSSIQLLSFMLGRTELRAAQSAGVQITGDLNAVRRFVPDPASPPARAGRAS
jgi:DNA-binding HxlR family transcriptional regulator